MVEAPVLLIAAAVGLTLSLLLIWQWVSVSRRVAKHPMLGGARLGRLPRASATRLRLARAAELFEEGWNVLQRAGSAADATAALACFARAAEVDETACTWKRGLETKLEMVGDVFAAATAGDEQLYHSMLAEAYMVLLLNTVVEIYGKPSDNTEEDFKVVKTRLDTCARLQPDNPAVYKLRADWCLRFERHCDRSRCGADYRHAIKLCEADPKGARVASHGADAAAQRGYLLGYCHHQLGVLLQKQRDFAGAAEHHRAALAQGGTDFAHAPDAHFNLAVIAVLGAAIGGAEGGTDAERLVRATLHFKEGEAAAKRVRRWLPVETYGVARQLAHSLIRQLSKDVLASRVKEAQAKRDE